MDDVYRAVGEGWNILLQVNNVVDDGYITVGSNYRIAGRRYINVVLRC